MVRKKGIWLISVSIMFLLLVVGCSSQANDAPSGEEEAEAPVHPVEIMEVATGTLSNELKISGNVMAAKHMPVLPMLTGEVKAIHVKNGDTVNSGDTLLELDATDVELNIAQARAGLEAAQANLNSAKSMWDQSIKQAETQLKQTKDMYDMLKNAESPSDVVLEDVPDELQAVFGSLLGSTMPTQQDISQAESAVKQAEMALEQAKGTGQIEAAESSVKQAEISVQMAQQQKTHSVVKAPISGQVTNFNAVVGEMVSPQAPLLQLVQMEKPIVQINATESMLPNLEVGQEVDVFIHSFNQSYAGEIKYISLLPGEQSRSYPVEIELIDPDESLRVGIHAEVIIDTDIASEQILIPVEAVSEENNEQFVFVTEDGEKVERRVITIENETAEWYAVESGLSEGEYIIVKGIHQLYDSALINIRNDIQIQPEEIEEEEQPVSDEEETEEASDSDETDK
ncbi:efflux RND transporter periplasmic adaptor subunit [Halalkalibacter krulwichiae]|uniref:Multidrug resistance protein MdtA n=1 Tax=Halalkalibacter krulwichiae TaxID=199441 RepID=A0A1X9MAP6_9BACI|nr:efflux RND transporter periplasmic adaptor subunit [Halalkalibacter krulwichiae]ARK30515.1 Multidrug resistance protein MdtA precursor [Halalkalibacter krulwichiae]